MKYQVATSTQIRKTKLAMAVMAICFSLPIVVSLALPLPSQAVGAGGWRRGTR